MRGGHRGGGRGHRGRVAEGSGGVGQKRGGVHEWSLSGGGGSIAPEGDRRVSPSITDKVKVGRVQGVPVPGPALAAVDRLASPNLVDMIYRQHGYSIGEPLKPGHLGGDVGHGVAAVQRHHSRLHGEDGEDGVTDEDEVTHTGDELGENHRQIDEHLTPASKGEAPHIAVTDGVLQLLAESGEFDCTERSLRGVLVHQSVDDYVFTFHQKLAAKVG